MRKTDENSKKKCGCSPLTLLLILLLVLILLSYFFDWWGIRKSTATIINVPANATFF